jgi:CRISPR-associated endonuclease/helicase Cas3
MDALRSTDFSAFFGELHGYDPFPWQRRLAALVCEEGWPESLDLPTASGKTACIDIAVFAMAQRMRGPRRVLFVVDRRVVVDAAFERMKRIAWALKEAKSGVVKLAADRLRELGKSEAPIDAYELRGGMYRDDSWVRSPLQPTLIASTVDQVGSRLLFRGYGVWDKVWPIHAALVANDSLILLDEAHCSRPFSEMVAAIQRYRGPGWARRDLGLPFAFVEMTATPARGSGKTFRLEDEDYQHSEMRKRLFAAKPTRLMVSKARSKDLGKLAADLVGEAVRLAEQPGLRRIGLMVNRVQTARLAYADLESRGCRAHLLIGRMRPVDRTALPGDLLSMLSGRARIDDGTPVFVVATQCLEVGADLDFDAIVTECASIDALLQRFGRLDRIGDLHESGVTAQGSIVISAPMTEANYVDPIYGRALVKTWEWLKGSGDNLDFGLCSEAGDRTVRERLRILDREAASEMQPDTPVFPALLPSHLDGFVQTFPRPALDPEVHLYLHGKQKGSPEVEVVWRSDLDTEHPELWAEIVALCPPVCTEAMPVPLRDFRRWLTGGRDDTGASSDIEGVDEDTGEAGGELRCAALRWLGDESTVIESLSDANRIRPGDTLVLPSASQGWRELGHIPRDAETAVDVAERARCEQGRRWVLRLHPALIKLWPENNARAQLMELAENPAAGLPEVLEALKEYRDQLGDEPHWLGLVMKQLPRRLKLEAYPNGGGGWVLSGAFSEADSGGDESSAAVPVSLEDHLRDVTREVSEAASQAIGDEKIRQSLIQAAQFHDCGKADIRFQALLHSGDPIAAKFAPKLLAKGGQAFESRSARQAQWRRSGLPDNFRHELASLLLAQRDPCLAEDDLALHLIASHHGRCRPFAPVVLDDGEELSYRGLRVTREERRSRAAHRIDSGVADRFWRLTRWYGWWGLAYLETLLRLSDWKASKQEVEDKERER